MRFQFGTNQVDDFNAVHPPLNDLTTGQFHKPMFILRDAEKPHPFVVGWDREHIRDDWKRFFLIFVEASLYRDNVRFEGEGLELRAVNNFSVGASPFHRVAGQPLVRWQRANVLEPND